MHHTLCDIFHTTSPTSTHCSDDECIGIVHCPRGPNEQQLKNWKIEKLLAMPQATSKHAPNYQLENFDYFEVQISNFKFSKEK